MVDKIIQYESGNMNDEEMVSFFIGYAKKFGYTKYEACILAAICKNESGPINKNKNRTWKSF